MTTDAPAGPLERIIAAALASRLHGPVTAGEIAAAIRFSCAAVSLPPRPPLLEVVQVRCPD